MSETSTEPAAEPTSTETTDPQQGDPAGDRPLGENGEKALQAEREARKSLEKQLREAQAKVEAAETAQLSELERAQRRAEKAEQDLAALQANTLRQKVALEKGLPASLVHRLQGGTEEELAADADALLELVRTPATPKPDPSQGGKGEPPALNSNGLEQALMSKLGIS